MKLDRLVATDVDCRPRKISANVNSRYRREYAGAADADPLQQIDGLVLWTIGRLRTLPIFPFWRLAMFRFRRDPDRIFETVDAALEVAEAENLDCVVVDRYGDYVARRRFNGRVEFPAGVFSAAESAQLALLRRNR